MPNYLSLIFKILLGLLGIAIIGYAFYLSRTNNILHEENTELKTHLENREALIDTQNKAIETLKIDVERYKKESKKVYTEIQTKYKYIEVENSTCESQLNTIKNAIDLFYDIHSRTR